MTHRAASFAWPIAKWCLGGLLAVVLLFIIVGNIAGRYLLNYTHEHFPPPGQIIALEGHGLHILCTGQGRPTVLLESGSGAWSTHWALVQTKVASYTRVCSYDRVGLGWSDPRPKPHDIRSDVHDLEELLVRTGEEGPFVFTGWSYGGSIVWLYAQGHVDQSAGLVMVDGRPGGWQTWLNQFAPELSARRARIIAQLRRLEGVGLGPVYSWYSLHGSSRDSIKGFPAGTGDVLLDPGFQARMFGAIIDASDADDISEHQMNMRPLGSVPLVVISHGREGMFGLAPDREHVAEVRWQESQSQLANQSTDAKLEIAAGSGHAIPLEQPDIIVTAIMELVTKWRARSTS
jgi:pimeloyl-ACP methyl ester carboxylesterase